jgi:ABC-type transport system substrate-binding protein
VTLIPRRRQKKVRVWRLGALALVIVLIVLAGCGTGAPVAAAPTSSSTATAQISATVNPTSPTTASPTAATAAPTGLVAMALIDVLSGETFNFAQFDGKVIIIQHMAVW